MPQALGDILCKLGNETIPAIKNCRLLELWREVVDENVAKNAEPVKIKDRTLFVYTSSSVWAQELTYLKQEIIRRFNEKAREEVIRDIRFKSVGSFN